MCHEKSFLCTKDMPYSSLIAFLAQYCTRLVCSVSMIAGKGLKGIGVCFILSLFSGSLQCKSSCCSESK